MILILKGWKYTTKLNFVVLSFNPSFKTKLILVVSGLMLDHTFGWGPLSVDFSNSWTFLFIKMRLKVYRDQRTNRN